ncbi:MAG: hypothetical protein GWN07_19275, partial [Actinobacteria bacterium]|nr:hypothetical protein [Actinomycetota bacterium]NIU67591.1 hypothetical protein [Actinomycetota bacterium]NIV85733.1 hypothetical protein [Actinomycetota bacterium]NIW29354.1 hypothetical protein [Actinomycetota bacterium]NIX21861.1 hypothetical protein [Actinomycetota bacterium]
LEKTDDGYLLRQAGRRIVEAVLSGTLTEAGTFVDAATDVPCPFCGAPIEIRYREELVAMYCTECPGAYGESARRTRPRPVKG